MGPEEEVSKCLVFQATIVVQNAGWGQAGGGGVQALEREGLTVLK
jgi:hypothetical protein